MLLSRNPRISPFLAQARGVGCCLGSRQRVLASPLRLSLGPAQDPACPGGESSRTGGSHAKPRRGSANYPGSSSRSGRVPTGPCRSCPAPECSAGAACSLGRGGCRERFGAPGLRGGVGARRESSPRSEEHTSELQSQTSISYAVFCLRWRRKWQPTPVFLPGESQGQGSMVDCRLWGHTELDLLPGASPAHTAAVLLT